MKVANIGKNIADLRKSKKKTAEQMAEALRVSRQTISKWENGETIPNAYNVLDMASYLDVNVSDIYGQILVDRIVKDTVSKEKTFVEEINDIIRDSVSEGLDEKKNLNEAIAAFDRSFIPFSVKVGFNDIRYVDILRRMNTGFVMGIKESEYPVESQIIKTEEFIIPAFVKFLNENGILSFYYISCTVGDPDSSLLLVIRNEYEILRFKELTKVFFIGLAAFKNHEFLRQLFAETVNEIKPKKRRFEIALFDSDMIIDEVDEGGSSTVLGSMDTEEEVNSLLEKIFSLESSVLEELLKYDDLDNDSIAVNDSENKDSILIYNAEEATKNKNYTPSKIRKWHEFDMYLINSDDSGKEKSFRDVSRHYMSFDTKEDVETEVKRILSLNGADKEELIKSYNDANIIMILDRLNREYDFTYYNINKPKIELKEEYVPDYIQRPKKNRIKVAEVSSVD
ncbi:helix-turn-helix transcriptional regulator [Candidatus Saccharibacteria bacterium]|nr:helix-turn-helix transcriptional regulator [Candidatus Saccharibacteria bacterium]